MSNVNPQSRQRATLPSDDMLLAESDHRTANESVVVLAALWLVEAEGSAVDRIDPQDHTMENAIRYGFVDSVGRHHGPAERVRHVCACPVALRVGAIANSPAGVPRSHDVPVVAGTQMADLEHVAASTTANISHSHLAP